MKKVFTLDNIEEISKEIIEKISKDSKDKATIIAFSGDLGAGKTTITKEIARLLGVAENVVSPTFVIMKIYKTKNKKFKKLIHIDAYRLNTGENLKNLNWEEIVFDKDNCIIVEWPERISEYLPNEVYNIKLDHKDEVTRTITLGYNI